MKNIKKKKHSQYIKQIYRVISYYFSEKLKDTSITPNQITISRILLIILISTFILKDIYIFNLGAAFFLILFSMFDALDGSLASTKNQFSVLGTWLDPQIDRLGLLLIFLTIAIDLSKFSQFYVYLTMYVLIIFFFRGLIPSDIRLKDKFKSLRDDPEDKKISGLRFETKKEKGIFYQIKLQTSPHSHNLVLYIAIGLIFNITNLMIIFLSLYLTIWYIWLNYKVISKAIKIDKR